MVRIFLADKSYADSGRRFGGFGLCRYTSAASTSIEAMITGDILFARRKLNHHALA